MHKPTVLALLAGLCFIGNLYAQQEEETTGATTFEAPDYQQIRQQISSSRSTSYYPTLFDRYLQCDTTLTLEDYRNLYFGFTLQEDYIPYQKENDLSVEARTLLIRSGASVEDCSTALAKAQEALLDNPFDLLALSVIPICYSQMGEDVNFHLWEQKLHGILNAIGSTGDGESIESAFHVINVEHEYEILNRLGLELDQVEVVNKHTDFVRVKSNTDSISGIYFNFGACSSLYKRKYDK